MEHAMWPLMRGGFDTPIKIKSASERWASQVNAEALENSKFKIVVVSLYANPLLRVSLRQTIDEQIDAANAFVRKNPRWIIATSPSEARAALSLNKRVLVLSLEGASGIIESQRDIEYWIGKREIRIVTLLHLTDDTLGGVAHLDGIKVLSSPLSALLSIPSLSGNNSRGLSPEGARLALLLKSARVWIDWTHASDRAFEDWISTMGCVQPVLFTHTTLRTFHPFERGLSDFALSKVKECGGFIGLMTTPSHISLSDWNLEAQRLIRDLPRGSVGIGSDHNGGIPHFESFEDISKSANIWGNVGFKQGVSDLKEISEKQTTQFLKLWDAVVSDGVRP